MISQAWQNLPSLIDPVALSIGSFQLRWYALMYLAGFSAAVLLLRRRVRRGESDFSPETIYDALIWMFGGGLLGGRFGYVVLYDFYFFRSHPLLIVSPFDPVTGAWTGIWGMSFFGAIFGASASLWLFPRRKKIDFWALADFLVPTIPAAIFFGRLGNFLNGELFGTPTDRFWGVYFPLDESGLLRHPSQLYEALLEGGLLFVVLWAIRRRKIFPGAKAALFLGGYGLARFVAEFFREREVLPGFLAQNTLSAGQWYAIAALLAATAIVYWKKPAGHDKLDMLTGNKK